MIYEYFRVTGTHETLLAFCDLMGGTLRRDHVRGFDTKWDEVLLSNHEMPSDSILKAQNKTQMREPDQLKTVLALYDLDILQKDMPPSNQRLKSMVKKFLDQEKKARNFQARNERIVTGTPKKSRSKGKSVSVERKNRETAFSGK